jgi:hypothetical protein
MIVVHWFSSRQLTKSYHFRIILGIDALGDMRRICGTTVAEGKDLYWFSSRQLTKSYHFRIILGIDAPGDMRRICGTTVAEGKDKLARVVKVVILNMYIFYKFNLSTMLLSIY